MLIRFRMCTGAVTLPDGTRIPKPCTDSWEDPYHSKVSVTLKTVKQDQGWSRVITAEIREQDLDVMRAKVHPRPELIDVARGRLPVPEDFWTDGRPPPVGRNNERWSAAYAELFGRGPIPPIKDLEVACRCRSFDFDERTDFGEDGEPVPTGRFYCLGCGEPKVRQS